MLLTEEDLEITEFEKCIRDTIDNSIYYSISYFIKDSIWGSIWTPIQRSIHDSIWLSVSGTIWVSVHTSIRRRFYNATH